MKHCSIFILALGLSYGSCNQSNPSTSHLPEKTSASATTAIQKSDDKTEIQTLIRSVLTWADSEKAIDLLPVVTDENDSIYIGFDLEKHRENLDKLEETGMFSQEFIGNYNQIILMLDKKLRTNDFEGGPWLVGYLPPFNFAGDVDPWCLCQDVPYDTPPPWEFVEVEPLNDQTYRWKWGRLNEGTDPSWKQFSYKFKVTKEESKWRVSYLEGFEFKP